MLSNDPRRTNIFTFFQQASPKPLPRNYSRDSQFLEETPEDGFEERPAMDLPVHRRGRPISVGKLLGEIPRALREESPIRKRKHRRGGRSFAKTADNYLSARAFVRDGAVKKPRPHQSHAI